MPSLPPPGEVPPADGHLPATALEGFGTRPFEVYVHVPFCTSRCGYCDFNTYTATELGDDVRRDTFATVLADEVTFARGITGPSVVDTVFVGGGTPTLIGADLLLVLDRIRDEYGLATDAEVTTEANPDSVDAALLEQLAAGGFTRISFGVQSSAPSVLRTLDRSHTAGAAERAIREARAAGFTHVSADLIIGTPGETDDDVRRTLDLVLDAGVDHVSAYLLIVEPGTPLARRIERGELAAPDDDVLADRYAIVDAHLIAAGMDWYEISNWSRPGAECRHNLGYWRGADWWGIGPGAHSHVGGVRWWNARHPRTYAEQLAAGASPAQGREVLTAEVRHLEAVMLGLRLAEGLPVTVLTDPERAAVTRLAETGALDGSVLAQGRVRVADDARLLADGLVREILG